MSHTIIKVNNLSKRYRIGAAEKRVKSFRELIMDGISAPVRNLIRLRSMTSFAKSNEQDIIWAVKDVSFEMEQGEVLGIIGRNGAGKSTLLKILSRITEPTSGSIEMHGRVSSLLEVGTGFHPELTGRENIFLNGAIMGMRKWEIEKKFDEIVEFSEVREFLDTPVKRYSSGMQVRLAFAVAAHLEPEILVVDEVLAVGDMAFQKKCLGKMEDMAGGGRTVLVVSHNMSLINRLCQRTILLEQGKIVEDGPTHNVVKHYLGSSSSTPAERKWDNIKNAPGDEIVRLLAVRAKNKTGEVAAEFNIQEPAWIEMEFRVLKEGWVIDNSLLFENENGVPLFATVDNSDTIWHNHKRPAGLYRVTCNVPGNLLNEGTIIVTAAIATYPNILHAIGHDVISFNIFDPGSGGARGDFTKEWPEVAVRPLLEWRTEQVQINDTRPDPEKGDR
jgi:lipopolysaccharide transport system ATP-binding protein